MQMKNTLKSETISMKGIMKPCPFCKRDLVLVRERWKNKNGVECSGAYYMHEEYDFIKEDSCLLDNLMMPFTIGAGDEKLEQGYLGEYAEEWNKCNPEHFENNSDYSNGYQMGKKYMLERFRDVLDRYDYGEFKGKSIDVMDVLRGIISVENNG